MAGEEKGVVIISRENGHVFHLSRVNTTSRTYNPIFQWERGQPIRRNSLHAEGDVRNPKLDHQFRLHSCLREKSFLAMQQASWTPGEGIVAAGDEIEIATGFVVESKRDGQTLYWARKPRDGSEYPEYQWSDSPVPVKNRLHSEGDIGEFRTGYLRGRFRQNSSLQRRLALWTAENGVVIIGEPMPILLNP